MAHLLMWFIIYLKKKIVKTTQYYIKFLYFIATTVMSIFKFWQETERPIRGRMTYTTKHSVYTVQKLYFRPHYFTLAAAAAHFKKRFPTIVVAVLSTHYNMTHKENISSI